MFGCAVAFYKAVDIVSEVYWCYFHKFIFFNGDYHCSRNLNQRRLFSLNVRNLSTPQFLRPHLSVDVMFPD